MRPSASRKSVYVLSVVILALIALSATIAAARRNSDSTSPQGIVKQMFAAYERNDLISAEKTFCDPQLARVMFPSADLSGGTPTFSGIRIETYAQENISAPFVSLETTATVQVTGTLITHIDDPVTTHDLAWTITTRRQSGKWCISSVSSTGWG